MRLLRIPEVAARVRLGKSTIYEQVKKGEFPAPLKQVNGNFWLDTEIDAYLAKLISQRPTSPPRPAS